MSEQEINRNQNAENTQNNVPAEQSINQNVGNSPPQYFYPPVNPYSFMPHTRKNQNKIYDQAASRRSFTMIVLSLIFGLLFSELVLRGGLGLSVPLSTLLFYIVALMYIPKKGKGKPKSSIALLIPIGLISAGFLFSDNHITNFLAALSLAALIPLQLCHMSGSCEGSIFSFKSIYHTFISTIARPVSFLDIPFKSIQSNIGKGKRGSKLLMVFLGIVIALPISALFISLFVRADQAFGYYIDIILLKTNLSYSGMVFDLVMGFLIAVFISSWFITLRAKKEPHEVQFKLKPALDNTLTATVLIILNIVQIAFVAVQLGYLFSGMTLPNNMTYAQYARSGFFELCTVLCISVAIIIFCMVLCKRDDHRSLPKSVSLLLTLFIACNFVIIASAIYRILFYITVYDLTVKRLMVTWLIIVFAFCMLGAVIKIWYNKFNILGLIAITVMSMTIIINFAGINSLISNYNVNCYIQSLNTNQVREIDIEYIGRLGPSAIKNTLRLFDNCEPKFRPEVKAALYAQINELEQKSPKGYTIHDIMLMNEIDGLKDSIRK